MFPCSSQKKYWIFSDENDLTVLREKTNADFIAKHGVNMTVSLHFHNCLFRIIAFSNDVFISLCACDFQAQILSMETFVGYVCTNIYVYKTLAMCYIFPVFISNNKSIKLTNSIITNVLLFVARGKGGIFSLTCRGANITPFLRVAIEGLLSSLQSTNASCYCGHCFALLQKILP